MSRNPDLRRLTWWLFTACLMCGLLAGCSRPPPPEESGELVVLTRRSPSTYFHNAQNQPSGFEYDLIRRFAEQRGWKLRILEAETVDELLHRIRRGEAHLAAAGLAVTGAREKALEFAFPYHEEQEWVICGPSVKPPKAPDGLVGLRLEVVAGSSHLENLLALKDKMPALTWEEVDAPSEEDLLERVGLGQSDCTLADQNSYDIARNFQPGLVAAFPLGTPRRIAWALPRPASRPFVQALSDFIREMERNGELAQLRERYFGHVRRLADADVLGILERRTRLLGELKPFFHEAEVETGIDWRLLAALAYQESQWDARAVSPTGVRGIMMLTGDTADRLGVKNRLDPRESILGGARYVVHLREALAEEIPEPDRTWMALAAYNIGPAHLEDARRLARYLGKDPNAWMHVKEVLPLIARSKYQRQLRYGFARGGEARTLAENVRVYYDILLRHESPYKDSIGLLD